MRELDSMIEKSKRLGTITEVRNMKTETGIKDTFLEHFLNRMADSYRNVKGKVPKTRALDEFCATSLPANIVSPVWRIDGMLRIVMTVGVAF